MARCLNISKCNMYNKNIIIGLILLVGILAVFSLVGVKNKAVLPVKGQLDLGSVLTVENPVFDFGEIRIDDGDVTTTFTVTNKTDRDIRIDSVATSCMCTTAYIINKEKRRGPFGMPGHGVAVPKANEVIGPGEERIIEVIFDPAAHGLAGLGFANRYVYLVDQDGGAMQLEIRAVVTY